MSMSKRRSKKPAQHLCQHPVSISYTPPKGVGPEVEMEIDESTSDVRTCTSVATYVLNGVHYCDRHFNKVTTESSGEYEEYGNPSDEPCDPQFSGGD
jgi:hypothetical protein